MRKVLAQAFFNRDTKIVAKELLGKFLVRLPAGRQGKPGREISAMITETEAYDGPYDKASHANKGKTMRTEIMFGRPGNFYVYLVYGMYHMLNVVTREHGYPAAVLIRGVEDADGPGKVTTLLQIDKSLNGAVAAQGSGLWFEDRGAKILPRKIKKLPRVGVNYAGPIWSAKNLRFRLDILS